MQTFAELAKTWLPLFGEDEPEASKFLHCWLSDYVKLLIIEVISCVSVWVDIQLPVMSILPNKLQALKSESRHIESERKFRRGT